MNPELGGFQQIPRRVRAGRELLRLCPGGCGRLIPDQIAVGGARDDVAHESDGRCGSRDDDRVGPGSFAVFCRDLHLEGVGALIERHLVLLRRAVGISERRVASVEELKCGAVVVRSGRNCYLGYVVFDRRRVLRGVRLERRGQRDGVAVGVRESRGRSERRRRTDWHGLSIRTT